MFIRVHLWFKPSFSTGRVRLLTLFQRGACPDVGLKGVSSNASGVAIASSESVAGRVFFEACELAHEPLSHVETPNTGSTQAFNMYHPARIANGNKNSDIAAST